MEKQKYCSPELKRVDVEIEDSILIPISLPVDPR